MTNPLYDYGEVVYLRESAAMGSLEAVKISGAHLGQNGWMYSINSSLSPASMGGHPDRRSHVSTQTLYYSEDEFLSLCDALVLVEANTKAAYERAKAQRQAFCPDNPTQG